MDPTAVMGRRIGAWVIDFIIGVLVFFIAFLIFGESVETGFDVCGIDGSPTLCLYVNDTVYFAEGGDAFGVYLLPTLAFLGMGWLLQGATGGTPGKLLVGLRVVDQSTGQLAGYGKCLGRTLLWIVDGFACYLVGLITGLVSKGHRRVGDMAAKTLVVDKGQVGIPPQVPGLNAPVGAPGAYVPPPAPGAAVPPGPEGYSPPAPAPAAGGYSPPAPAPGGYTPPAPQPAAAPIAEPVPQPAAEPEPDGISAPKWDADRNAYIQWDAGANAWMQFDDAAGEWKPIQ